jgi:hypothetical protein
METLLKASTSRAKMTAPTVEIYHVCNKRATRMSYNLMDMAVQKAERDWGVRAA